MQGPRLARSALPSIPEGESRPGFSPGPAVGVKTQVLRERPLSTNSLRIRMDLPPACFSAFPSGSPRVEGPPRDAGAGSGTGFA